MWSTFLHLCCAAFNEFRSISTVWDCGASAAFCFSAACKTVTYFKRTPRIYFAGGLSSLTHARGAFSYVPHAAVTKQSEITWCVDGDERGQRDHLQCCCRRTAAHSTSEVQLLVNVSLAPTADGAERMPEHWKKSPTEIHAVYPHLLGFEPFQWARAEFVEEIYIT